MTDKPMTEEEFKRKYSAMYMYSRFGVGICEPPKIVVFADGICWGDSVKKKNIFQRIKTALTAALRYVIERI
jgi:hypothetical protein